MSSAMAAAHAVRADEFAGNVTTNDTGSAVKMTRRHVRHLRIVRERAAAVPSQEPPSQPRRAIQARMRDPTRRVLRHHRGVVVAGRGFVMLVCCRRGLLHRFRRMAMTHGTRAACSQLRKTTRAPPGPGGDADVLPNPGRSSLSCSNGQTGEPYPVVTNSRKDGCRRTADLRKSRSNLAQ